MNGGGPTAKVSIKLDVNFVRTVIVIINSFFASIIRIRNVRILFLLLWVKNLSGIYIWGRKYHIGGENTKKTMGIAKSKKKKKKKKKRIMKLFFFLIFDLDYVDFRKVLEWGY